jgi:hypothetical protein
LTVSVNEEVRRGQAQSNKNKVLTYEVMEKPTHQDQYVQAVTERSKTKLHEVVREL